MITRCDGQLGWPVEDVAISVPSDRTEIVAQLEQMRDELEPEWSPKRGVWNLAVLIAKGKVRARRR